MSLANRSLTKDFPLIILTIVQIAFWWQTHNIKPKLDIMDSPPSEQQAKAISFGDSQFYFRYLAFQLQNFGDTFGRSTPLKDYNYPLLEKWFFLMDSLDSKSHIVPALASYYFSNSQNPEDNRYIIAYLSGHFERNPNENWWWMSNAIQLARYKLKDKKLAAELADKIGKVDGKDIPIWVKQMPAFVHEEMGEKEAAMRIMENIAKSEKNLSDTELNFMRYFIEERLKEDIPDYLKNRESKE